MVERRGGAATAALDAASVGAGTGVPCAEGQADGVPCDELKPDCEDCERVPCSERSTDEPSRGR